MAEPAHRYKLIDYIIGETFVEVAGVIPAFQLSRYVI
jgi:hypothetical protein